MNYKVRWDSRSKEFLKKIDKTNAQRIIKKVNSILDDPKHYLESLVDINGYKLRVGDYRALIDLYEDDKLIDILLIGHRKDIYKYIKRAKFRVKK